MDNGTTTHNNQCADAGGGRGARVSGLPPWVGAAPYGGLAPAVEKQSTNLLQSTPQSAGSREAPADQALDRADFVEKYETALQAIRDGLWPIPTDAWVAHMAVVAGYFDHALQVRVREGLLLARRWRRHARAGFLENF